MGVGVSSHGSFFSFSGGIIEGVRNLSLFPFFLGLRNTLEEYRHFPFPHPFSPMSIGFFPPPPFSRRKPGRSQILSSPARLLPEQNSRQVIGALGRADPFFFFLLWTEGLEQALGPLLCALLRNGEREGNEPSLFFPLPLTSGSRSHSNHF